MMITREVPKDYDLCDAPIFVHALWQHIHCSTLGELKILANRT